MTLLALLACSSAGPPGTESVPDTSDTGHTATDTHESVVDTGEPLVFVDARLEQGGVVTCADPSARAAGAFVEKTDGDWATETNPGRSGYLAPWGLVVADLDLDGLLDIFVPGRDGRSHMFMGLADGDWDASSGRWGQDTDLFTRSASAADWDGDGDLDIFLGTIGPDVLYENNGTGRFSPRQATGAEGGDWESLTESWGDMDGDGDLDLFVSNHYHKAAHTADTTDAWPSDEEGGYWGDPNGLFENLGDGTFVERSERLSGLGSVAPTRAGGWYDVDQDGDQDFYVVNDKPQDGFVNVLLLNDGAGYFTEVRGNGLDIAVQGMGLGVGDDNDDGILDFVVTGWQEVPFLLSLGGGAWYSANTSRGIAGGLGVGWGIELADMDNDGDLDIIEANGPLFDVDDRLADGMTDNPAAQAIALFVQGDDGMFSEQGEAAGLTTLGAWRGMVLADLNYDGFLDVVARDVLGTPHMYLSRCDDAAWLRVALRGPAPNRRAIGARVEVRAGGEVWRRWTSAGSTSHASSGPSDVHFGLGDLATVDSVRVIWPDGQISQVTDVPTSQAITITRSDAPEY